LAQAQQRLSSPSWPHAPAGQGAMPSGPSCALLPLEATRQQVEAMLLQAKVLETSPNSLAATQQQSKESRARFRELDKAQADLRRERKKCEDAIEASRRHNLARQRAEERLRQARRALAAATAGDDPAPEWLQQLVLVLSQDLDDEADALPFSAMSSEAVNMPISDRVDAFAVSASTPEEFFDLGQQVLLEAGGTSAPESRRDSIASDATPELPPDLQGKFYQAATAGSSVATSAACAGEEPPLEEPAPEPLELDVQPWRATTMRSPSALAEGHYESLMAAAGRSPAWQPDSDACQCCKGRFTLVTRRHHCRQCGRCICARCSPFRVYMESPLAGGRRQPGATQKGGVYRACTGCCGPDAEEASEPTTPP